MRGRQLRAELRGPLQLFDCRLKLTARQIEQPEYQMGLGGAEFPEDLVNQRAPFLDLFVLQIRVGQRVGDSGVVGLRAVNLLEFRRRFFQLALLEQTHPQQKARLQVVGLRFDDLVEFAQRLLVFIDLVIGDAEIEADRVFFRIDGQRLLVPDDRLIVLAEFGEDDAEVRERVNPARDQFQRGLVRRASAFQIALLLQLDPARKMLLRLANDFAFLSRSERERQQKYETGKHKSVWFNENEWEWIRVERREYTIVRPSIKFWRGETASPRQKIKPNWRRVLEGELHGHLDYAL